MKKPLIAISLLGTQLDFVGKRVDRWSKWRPNVSLCSQSDLPIQHLHLLHDNHSLRLANKISDDIHQIAEHTHVDLHPINFSDPWDFEEVFGKLFDWAQQQHFDTEQFDYLFHISTGTHVAQICFFLLAESQHFPGRLIQTMPDASNPDRYVGATQIIDLDLSRYDQLASRFDQEHQQGQSFLKAGIETRNAAFNRMIEQIEKVAIRSPEPILLTGPTGAGKTQLAERIFQLKKMRGQIKGEFVSVNCATLRGENAMAALFGHTKGAFTGALTARAGFLRTAHNGLLFLDEIGELGQEEQAMLLHAIENKQFHPVGSDQVVKSDFQLIAGTNRNLQQEIQQGRFREDLLARINLWSYALPSLQERSEDIPANLDYELEKFSQRSGRRVRFNKEARQAFEHFAQSPRALWPGNFRDLGAAVIRLCTLADSSRISGEDVTDEIARLEANWQPNVADKNTIRLENYLSQQQIDDLDLFDAHQLSHVLSVCEKHNSLAAAGRELFQVSRTRKNSSNDSARLQKYLAKYAIKINFNGSSSDE